MKFLRKGLVILMSCTLFVTMTVAGLPEIALATPGDTVSLQAFNVSANASSISDGNHQMTGSTINAGTVQLTEDDKLPANLNSLAPKMSGWTFVGWYTAPVKYAFWGDTTTQGWDSAPLPAGFSHDCNGAAYDFSSKEPGASLSSYWRWLSALEGSGHKVNPGESADGASTLYALYKPNTISYKLDYSGYNGNSGVLDCTRQYGTPFGNNHMASWNGFVFDGWYLAGTNTKMSFYSIPANGARYVAHWHSSDGRVNWSNYREVGYSPVTKVTLKDAGTGSGMKDLGDTLNLHAGNSSNTIEAVISPANNGVTKLTWHSSDTSVAQVDVLNDGTRAVIRSTGKAGTAIVTVSSANGCSDSVTVDSTGHAFDKSQVVKWGNCTNPTVISYTCVYCGKTETRETYSSHRYAYREIPATCTTPCIWEHYCEVCGQTDHANDIIRGAAKGHNFHTTTSKGCGGTVTTKTCSTCGLVETTKDTSTATHVWASYPTVDVRATCSHEGSQSVKCIHCGTVKPHSSTVIPADASLHVWKDWKITKNATATEPGSKTRVCSVCHTEETRAIMPTSYKVDTSAVTGGVSLAGSKQLANKAQADSAIKHTLDKLLTDGDSMLADDILYADVQDKEISTEVVITPVANPETKADLQKFKKLIGDAFVQYMDIDIFVKADDESFGRITETEEAITLNVDCPAGEGRIIQVLRAHEGEVEVIPSWVENNMVYFSTDRFSTFAVSASNDIAWASVDKIGEQNYTGSEIKPAVEVVINGKETLKENTDYTVSYKDNVKAGTATIVIDGKGDFAGTTKEVNFSIVRPGMEGVTSVIKWVIPLAIVIAGAVAALIVFRRKKAASADK